ncbi:hypothetical protein GN958_ATG12301 [Phytophthora infestans]|uniref:Crinkler (CRN) family protein n=1 Tax=Phytophthora infestans TaxID=4787 RepID=A0A8S9UH16_PHYIN|nr:hypothetical protein GN958_ATG12301 [Phytophthora infestans]
MDNNDGFVETKAEMTSPSGGAAFGLTEEFPPDLPMQYSYETSRFYVRKCYQRYYDLVLQELFTRDKRCVTVTGSPGTGKSVFYGYFFNHFTREEQYRGFTIITASFTKYLQDIAVFENGKSVPKPESLSNSFWLENLSERKEPRIIYLYDGPPRISPKHQKMVCFTSPNERWLDSLYKDFSQTTLYMPLWDEDELFAAATSLRIDSVITRAVIDKRIGLFGFVARECLSQRERFVEDRLILVQQTIEEMSTLEPQRLVRIVTGVDTHHCLSHYVPHQDDPRKFDVRMASQYVRRRVLEKINVVVSFEEFANGYKQLRCNPQAAMDRGFSFLLKTYDLVRRGGKIHTITIGGSGHSKTFRCQKSKEFFLFDPKELSPAVLQTGPFHISVDTSDESIDSFYYPTRKFVWKKRLLVFLTKEVYLNPVSGQALVTVLEKLELLKKALKNPRSVRLILVALELDENKWKFKKRIQWDLLLNAENVDIIPGVDTSQLKAINMETVKDLRTAIDAPSAHQRDFFSGGVLTHYSTILKSFDERQNAIETMLTKIPVYVLEV